MARFGLLDSDDEVSDASSQHSQEDEHSQVGDSTINSHSSHSEDEDEELLEDAPPQASLLSDEEEQSQSDDDESIDQPHSRRSRSYSHLTRTPSPPPPTNSRQRQPQLLPPSASSKQQPWAQQLNLEPNKVQLMQASFFGQDTTTRMDSIRVRERERDEKEKERETKRRAVEEGFANRVKQGKRDQASLFASTSTPAPTAVQSQPQSVPTPILDPAPFRPYRTYTRVPLSTSTTNGKEQYLVDSGLALGRSSRVGWGPNGEMVSLRGVYEKDKDKEGKSDVVKIEKLRLLENNQDKAASLRLLELQLSQTQIFPSSLTDPSSSSSVPFASPNPSLRFSHFVDLFNKTPSDSQTQDLSNSSEAQLFKLASLLFDEIPSLGLSSSLDLSYLPSPSTYTSSITALRRVDLLSSWLTHSLLPSISSSLHSPSLSSLEKIFLLLTTHQISQACDLALSSNNLRLATLISQIGTISSAQTDPQFQQDLSDQLSKWKEFKVDSHMTVEVRKIYELLSGNLGVSQGRTGVAREDESKEFHVLEGREWNAAFAMGLWYSRQQQQESSSSSSDQIVTSLNQYDSTCFNSTSVSAPTPSYLLSSSSTTRSTPETPLDPIYHLLKLYTSPTHSLEQFLNPLNFGPSSTDYRLPWHLYLMFSRVLRRRDFEDRVEFDRDEMNEDENGEEREGNSVRADMVTVSYAKQLESLGMWEWSAFVLMHLELEVPRKQALESLMLRNVSHLTPQTTSFLTSQLQIPSLYLSLAKLTSAESSGQVFTTYKLSLTCQMPEKAHRIVVEELCPEAIVRGDEGLCRRLLEPFREDREDGDEEENDGEFRGTVEGWEEGGKIYLQYLHTLSLFSDPSTSTASSSQVYLSSTIQSIQGFVKRTRSVERMKGNKKLRMALSEMSSRLNVLSRAVGGKALNVTQPSLLGESEKLVWLQGATGSFLQGAMKRAGVV